MYLGLGLSIARLKGSGADAYAINGFTAPLVLDFASEFYRVDGSSSTFTDAVTFSRSSAATYTDSDGLLQTAASGTPRIGNHVWDGTSWVNEGLLIESAAATNLVTYSTNPTLAWSQTNMLTMSTDSIGPDGATSASRMVDNSLGSAGVIVISRGFTVSSSTQYTFSIFAKADQLDWVAIETNSFTTPANGFSYFDLTNCALGTASSGHTLQIENCGNGWCRCSVIFTTDAADTSGVMRVAVSDGDGSIVIARDGTSSIFIYGPQLEAGSVPTSYIPTAGSTVTRAAETATVAAENMPAYTTAVSIQTDGTMTYADNDTDRSANGLQGEVVWWGWRLNTANLLEAVMRTDGAFGTGAVRFGQESSSVQDGVTSANSYFSPGINVPFNIASRHGSTFINGAVDGTALTADLTPTSLPDLSATDFQIATTFNGNIGKLVVWSDDIGDVGIEEASA